MTAQQAERLANLTSQLAATLMTAVICADELRSTIDAELERTNGKPEGHGVSAHPASRPLLDQSTFSVLWCGRRLQLGHTREFWLLNRLAQCPNQYVTHLDLLHDVWDNEDIATATIRSVVRYLRRQLRYGGMADLADCIRGYPGHYVLTV